MNRDSIEDSPKKKRAKINHTRRSHLSSGTSAKKEDTKAASASARLKSSTAADNDAQRQQVQDQEITKLRRELEKQRKENEILQKKNVELENKLSCTTDMDRKLTRIVHHLNTVNTNIITQLNNQQKDIMELQRQNNENNNPSEIQDKLDEILQYVADSDAPIKRKEGLAIAQTESNVEDLVEDSAKAEIQNSAENSNETEKTDHSCSKEISSQSSSTYFDQETNCSSTSSKPDTIQQESAEEQNQAISTTPEFITIKNNIDVQKIEVFNKPLKVSKDYISSILTFTNRSDNTKLIAAASYDKNIYIIRQSDKKLIKTIKKHTDLVISLAITTSSVYDNKGEEPEATTTTQLLVSGGDDAEIYFWDIQNDFASVGMSWKCQDKISKILPFTLTTESENKERQMLAFALEDTSIELWDIEEQKKVETLRGGHDKEGFIFALDIFKRHDNNKLYLLSGDINSKLNLWCLDYKSKRPKTISGDKGIYSLVTFVIEDKVNNGDGDGDIQKTRFIATGGKGVVTIWKMNDAKSHRRQYQIYHEFDNIEGNCVNGIKVFFVACTDNNANATVLLSTVNEDGWFHCFDVRKKTLVNKIHCKNQKFFSLDIYEEEDHDSSGDSSDKVVFVAGGLNGKTKRGELVFLKIP